MKPSIEDIIASFDADAEAQFETYESVSSADIYAPVADFLPLEPGRIVDIGAGTGRDAAWFAAQGHDVLAVEPARGLREAGQALHLSPRITWLDDRLPELAQTLARAERFDRVLLYGVWHLLTEDERRIAMPKLAALTASGGMLILALRHGRGYPERPCHPCDPNDMIALGAANGLIVRATRPAESVLPANRVAGVTRTWLAFAQVR